MTEKIASFGIVKWFGGYNKKTGKENNFGFLFDISGEDIYLHKNNLSDNYHPNELDVYSYDIEEQNNSKKAVNIKKLKHSTARCKCTFLALKSLKDKKLDGNLSILKRALTRSFIENLPKTDESDLKEIVKIDQGNYSYELINDEFSSKTLSDEVKNWEECFERLSQHSPINIFKELRWSTIPPKILRNKINDLAHYINSISKLEASNKCKENLSRLPIEFIFHLFIKNIFTSRDNIESRTEELENFVVSYLTGSLDSLPEYAKYAYENELKPLGGFRASPILWEIIEPHLFKKYLFDKSQKFINLYEASSNLKNDPKCFILFNIFSLIQYGNDVGVTYQIFTQKFWEAIVNGSLDLDIKFKDIMELFPSCGTLGKNLSCEAVFWEKNKSYLCRGSKCINPQIIPNTNKHFLQYNIYDWFSHFGIDYTKSRSPSNKDFPIKLAGFFNRIKEIYPIIHCRDCGTLMLPDFRYSRTKYQTYKDGKFVTKDMAAAYRLTVFHCNTPTCNQYSVGYYISHCIGFGCYKIIDTRDLKIQCDAGRYICDGCGSCCEIHNKSNPVGLCSNCGHSLQLIESENKDYLGRKIRRVKCGASCGFTISSNNLPKKFHLPTCQPVLQESMLRKPILEEVDSEFDLDI